MSKANGALGAIGKVVTYILVVLLVLGVAGMVAYFALRGQGVTYSVEYNGKQYLANGGGGYINLPTGEEQTFSVKSLSDGEVNYDVKIVANSSNNFAFSHDGKTLQFVSTTEENNDYSEEFCLQKKADGFSLFIPDHSTVMGMIEKKYGGSCEFGTEFLSDKSYFVISITAEESVVNLWFTFDGQVIVPVDSIDLSQSEIIFGGETVVTLPENPSLGAEHYISYDTLSLGCSGNIEFNCQATARANERVSFTIGYSDPVGRVSRVVAMQADGGEELFDIDETDGVYTFTMPDEDIIVMIYLVAD